MNCRLRLLYSFPHTLGRPGIGTTALHQVRALIEQGVSVTVYCTSTSDDIPGAQRVVKTMVWARRRIPHRVLGIDRTLHFHDATVARSLRRRPDNFDVVHCWPGAAAATLRAAKAVGIPGMREVPNTHTAFAYEAVAREMEKLGLRLPSGHSHRPNPRRLAREESEYRLATRLLIPSAFVESTFLDRGFRSDQLARHQYGFDPTRFHVDERPLERPFTVTFVGRCEPRKGLHLALRAWKDSGASGTGRFLICGEFVSGYRELLRPLLGPSVRVLGYISEVAEVLRDSDVLVLPSIEEGSALVTYEAQGCGCVLAVSDASGARCEHLRTGLVHPAGDVQQLTEHLRLLSTNRMLLARMREATLDRLDDLTWSAAARRLTEIYRSCAVR